MAIVLKCQMAAYKICCAGKCTDPMQDIMDCKFDKCPESAKDMENSGITMADGAAAFGCATRFLASSQSPGSG
jgi:hypothetical protein